MIRLTTLTTCVLTVCTLLATGCNREQDKETGVTIDDSILVTETGKIISTKVIDLTSLPAGSEQVTQRFSNGRISGEGWICDNQPVGPWTYYHDDGTLAMEGQYLYGKLETDTWRYYHTNGRLQTSGSWKQGKRVKVWKHYHRNGTPAAEGLYRNGTKMGVWKTWFDNGNAQSIGKFEDDTQSGMWRYWNEKGQYVSQRNFNRPGKAAFDQ